ncbi:MAG: C25 family cysteine peptidase [Methanobacteriota archaeon]
MKKITIPFPIHLLVLTIAGILLIPMFAPVNLVSARILDPVASLTYSFSFEQPTILRASNGYDHVKISGLLTSADPGKPGIPIKGISIPLPLKTKVKTIHIQGESVCLGEGYLLQPGEPLITFVEALSDSQPQPDPLIYSSDQLYPGSLFMDVGTNSFRGFDIVDLTLYPVQYRPKSGELFFYPELKVIIDLMPDDTRKPLLRGLQKDVTALQQKIQSDEINQPLLEVPEPAPLAGDNYDLLILTMDGLKNGFIPLAEKHNATGIRTRVKTLTDVGGNTPEAIRLFITNAYQNDGIEYVLLGGDIDVIPVKGLYAQVGGEVEEHMPSDLYYSCLEGNFDGNGNGIYGEAGDSVDLRAEVYVGRAPVNTLEEVQHFCTKTIAYIDAGIASGNKYIGRVVLAGEKLWDDPVTWGGSSLDELVDGSTHNGYTTVGIPSSTFSIYRLYEREGAWTKTDLINSINNGLYIIDHLGHGSLNQVAKLTSNDVLSLTNNKYFFMYSQACNTSQFDDPAQDCVAEYLTVKTDHGAFATIMNSREGWYVRGSTDGPSHRYNREFWDAIFSESTTNPNMTRFGVANQDSKEDNIYRINEQAMRWCYYTITFFGDPTLKIYDPIAQPVLAIDTITGGWGIHTSIKNTGNADASTVTWTITSKGGLFRLVNKTFDDDFGPLGINKNESVSTRPFIGIGRIEITVTASTPGDIPTRKTTTLLILGLYVLPIPERLQQFFNQ